MEIYAKQFDAAKTKRRPRRKAGTKQSESGKFSEIKGIRKQIYSSFCPECQGTGVNIDGNELEKPTVPLSEVCDSGLIFLLISETVGKKPNKNNNLQIDCYFPVVEWENIQAKATDSIFYTCSEYIHT